MARSTSKGLRLSPARRRQLRAMVASGRFASLNEALDYCVRQGAKVEAARTDLASSLREAERGPYERGDEAWWDRLRSDVTAQRRGRSRRKSA
ncbi:MAG TPA: hypothetical protein VHC70_12020 [Phycisphaerales bacterium]|nr:hypothetical protein [Phycisphaerales bacterium]